MTSTTSQTTVLASHQYRWTGTILLAATALAELILTIQRVSPTGGVLTAVTGTLAFAAFRRTYRSRLNILTDGNTWQLDAARSTRQLADNRIVIGNITRLDIRETTLGRALVLSSWNNPEAVRGPQSLIVPVRLANTAEFRSALNEVLNSRSITISGHARDWLNGDR